MKKIFIISLMVMGLVGLEAKALVQQSASDALSFKNVVNNSSSSKKTVRRVKKEQVKEKVVPETKKLDLRSGVTKSVSLTAAQDVIVTLSEKGCETWKVTYDKAQISMVDNDSDGNNRQITFKQKSSKGSTIYLDCVDDNGKIVQNKAVYVRAN